MTTEGAKMFLVPMREAIDSPRIKGSDGFAAHEWREDTPIESGDEVHAQIKGCQIIGMGQNTVRISARITQCERRGVGLRHEEAGLVRSERLEIHVNVDGQNMGAVQTGFKDRDDLEKRYTETVRAANTAMDLILNAPATLTDLLGSIPGNR